MRLLAAILATLALIGTGWMWGRMDRDQEPARRTEEARSNEVDPRCETRHTTPKPAPEPKIPAAPSGKSTAKAKPDPYRGAEQTSSPDRAALRVWVFDEFDRAIADGKVSLTLSVGGVGKSGPRGKTDASGQAFFDDLHADEVIAASVRIGNMIRSARIRLTNGHVKELKFRFPGGVTVKGTIRDVTSGPIPFVVVTLVRSLDDGFTVRAFGNTDEDGDYSIDGVPDGKYEVQLAGGGLRTEDRPRPRKIGYHEQNQRELEVVAPGPVTRDIVLGRLSIEGTVRDATTGVLLTGVTVNLQSPHYALTATNDQGRFRVTSMPPGKYTILIRKDGYALKFEKDVEIRENEVARVDFTIERAARLHIHLKNTDGDPVTGEHWVRFDKPDNKGWSSNLRTDAEGHILSQVVPLGVMRISVDGAGWKGGPIEVEVKEGENHVEIPLRREGGTGVHALSGVVRDKRTGAPIAGARLRIQTGMARETYTDKSGRFVFEDLRAGSYRVFATRDGYGDTTVPSAKVEAGKEATIEIDLFPAATIHLRVIDSSGSPVAGRVFFVYAGGTPAVGRGLHLELDEDGRASFRRLPPGPYSITVHVDGRGKGSLKQTIRSGDNTLAVRIERE